MFSLYTINREERKSRRAVVTLGLSATLILTLVGQCALSMPVIAQDASPDQDSLLPPEVVPLDPSAASAMSSSQASSRQASMSNPVSQYTAPQYTGSKAPAQGEMQTAQDFRKAAFDSLYGKGQFPTQSQSQNPNLQALNGQMGQLPNGQAQPGSFAQQNPALSQSFNPGMMANQQAGGMQTQTLSGTVSQPAQQSKQSNVSKISHAASVGTSLGGLGLMGGAMSGNPMSFFGVGLMGVGMLNYGLRGGKF